MKINKIRFLPLYFLVCWCAVALAASAATDVMIELMYHSAELSGDVGMGDGELNSWRQGGTATWSFETPKNARNVGITLSCAATRNRKLHWEIDGGGDSGEAEVQKTGAYENFTLQNIATVTLPGGTHTLRLSYDGPGYLMNLDKVYISTRPVGAINPSYPPLYTKQADWPESMIAMRKVFQSPMLARHKEFFRNQIDQLYLNETDGKALWTDFPRECDWFLQDNQVHDEWGRGVYDARGDYKHYLDPDRDSTLEKKLIENVLSEIDAPELQQELDALHGSPDDPAWLKLYVKACGVRRQQRLAPLLKETKQIIYATHMNMGTIYLATETQGCPDGSQLRLIDLTPEAKGLPLKDELLFDSQNGIVRDPELSFDGKNLLFAWRKTNERISTTAAVAPETGNYKIYEMNLATRALRQLTDDKTYGADFEPCFLPDGNIMFSSDRCVQEVTCGWGDCPNLYVMDGDGKYARRVGFDQTQTAFPHLLSDGRVVFTRRDYNDRGQSYAHALIMMNPDGTFQTEYYGNNSMAPTSIQHTRAIPGSRKTMGVAGGYHTSQGGKLVTIDVSKGRQNYDGLTFYNWEPTPLAEVHDENYCRVGEQYTYPYPFNENSLLVSLSPIGCYLTKENGVLDKKKEQGLMLYKLYYMTLDGKRELLAAHPHLSCTQAIPVRPRPAPPARPSLVDYTKKTGTCYVQDVYYGPSAEGIKRGSIKKLRVVQLHYKPTTIGAGGWSPPRDMVGPGRKYAGYGWHSVLPAGVGSVSFDTKTILGEVDVHSDGSAMFNVPARTPLYFQLIDENGLVVQTMRSWATLMPNETFSCVGCHEENDSAPLPQASRSIAMQNAPQKLQPVHNISGMPFSYPKLVQPIWDKHCVSCHAPGKKADHIDLSNTLVSDNKEDRGTSSTRRKFNQSYLTLLQVKWVSDRKQLTNPRLDEGRPNEWISYYTRMATMELTPPFYAGSTQSGLIKMLQEGHEKTKLTPDEIGTVAAWIDLNAPYVGEYDEMNIWDDKAKNLYKTKMGIRNDMEAIEAENIAQYIKEVQEK